MSAAYIIGVGQSRFGKFPDSTVRGMAEKAVNLALIDAGLSSRDLQSVFFANSLWGYFDGQHCIRGQVVLRGMGIDKIPVYNVENACAGGATALHLATMAVQSGQFDFVLALGAEKMTHADQLKSFEALRSGTDLENFDSHIRELSGQGHSIATATPKDSSTSEGQHSIFMEPTAVHALWHMDKYGTTREQLAHIASKNHYHGSLNPRSQYQQPISVEEVLADREIVHPFTRTMCAPIGDGAAAAIICSERALKQLGNSLPVKIAASAMGQGSDRELGGEEIAARLAAEIYEKAGIGPEDIDVAEVHDATAYGELRQLEALGFCPEGEGGPFSAQGNTTIGGKIPVNTSGGLECRGHPVAATGLAQAHEVVTQLRDQAGVRQVEGARTGLTLGGGGYIGVEEAVMCLHIFELSTSGRV